MFGLGQKWWLYIGMLVAFCGFLAFERCSQKIVVMEREGSFKNIPQQEPVQLGVPF